MNSSQILECKDFGKILGRFKGSWMQLTNFKKYISDNPKSFEEKAELDKLQGLNYNNKVIYMPSQFTCEFEQIVNDIYSINGIADIMTKKTIERSVEFEITQSLEKPQEINSAKNARAIIEKCFADCEEYTFYRIVDGLKLEDVSIQLGEVQIFNTDEMYISELLKISFAELPEDDKRRQLINKVMIRCKAFGDKDMAKTKSLRKFREALNLIRFLICILYKGGSIDNSLKVNLLAEAYIAEENIFFIDNAGYENWEFQVTNKILIPFEVNPQIIENLHDTDFFSKLISLINKNEYTELEQALLTSIYWIGEAQNDYSLTHTFIKYWSGIEALIYNPPDNKGVTDLVENGLATVLTYGGFKLDPSRKINDYDKKIKDLYEKRSLIVHRGQYEVVTANDIYHVSKMAVYMALNCLVLCDYGYKKLENIKKEADRLRAKQKRKGDK